MNEQFLLSEKYKRFLECSATTEFLEGTTAAGKTTVAIVKFILKAYASPKKLHILSGLDLGTIEKNIINKNLGIVDQFKDTVNYNASGRGAHSMPHIVLYSSEGEKIIYILGYDNKTRWKKALGGQYGCVYIDEINIADMEYVREISMRCDYLLATLNPDDPSLPVYEEYINHSRPLAEWVHETPKEITELLIEEEKQGWVHWFFDFTHNLGLKEEKKQQIISSVAPGTKLYKNKIQGLRGRATGLIFNLEKKSIITRKKAKEFKFILFTAGVDTSYSLNTDDVFAFYFAGITECGKQITLATKGFNNAKLAKPLAPSDIPPLLEQFLEVQHNMWGFAREVYIDSGDSATITECGKYKRQNGSIYNFVPAWKKTQIIDRIQLQSGWMARGDYLILDECVEYQGELNLYSWQEDKYAPEDRNDHFINAGQYAWLPYKHKIGDLRKK